MQSSFIKPDYQPNYLVPSIVTTQAVSVHSVEKVTLEFRNLEFSHSVDQWYLQINAISVVVSYGWHKPHLIPRIYENDYPEDGFWEFEFLSYPPCETVIQRLATTSASLQWLDYHFYKHTLKGIRVIAATNQIEVLFDESDARKS